MSTMPQYTPILQHVFHPTDFSPESDIAFAHALNHVHGTLPNGHTTDLWVRWTACFQQVNGIWLITHDHVSVPADLKQGKAVLDLTP